MYRQINCTHCRKKINCIESYFAYRLPSQTKVHYLKGEVQLIENFSVLPKDCIVVNSFDSKQTLVIADLVEIEESEFKLSFLSDSSTETSQVAYKNSFEQMMSALQKKEVDKIVLSRIKKVVTTKSGLEILNALNKNYAATYNYILSNELLGTWLGASPELLLKATKDKIETVALAGTKLANARTDWTQKEITEQKIVTDFILETLKSNGFMNSESNVAHTVNAGKIDHLKTDISATIKNTDSIYTLLKDLHPTPATCGFPKQLALEKIIRIENHPRKLYAGFIGVLRNGEQDFFVNLRCMELFSDATLLYVGGGLTVDSNLESEWLETERKATTLEDFL